MVTNTLLGVEFIKVVNTKVLVGFVVAEHVIDDHQQAVLDRTNGALFSTSSGQTMVLRFEIAIFGSNRSMGHFAEHRIEVAVGRRGLATFAFAGTFMIPRTLPCPGNKMFMCISQHFI